MANEKKLYVDIDEAIETYNTNNPQNKIDRRALAEMVGLDYQSLVNYHNGRTPKAFETLKKILDKTGATFNQIIKYK